MGRRTQEFKRAYENTSKHVSIGMYFGAAFGGVVTYWLAPFFGGDAFAIGWVVFFSL